MRTTRFVDLGLTSGTLWANKNVGADRITDAGIYMSNPSTFFYKDKNYHIPTKEQFEELIRECTWKWIEKNDVFGYRITGKNDRYIFLPITGFYDCFSLLYSGAYGNYWCSNTHNSSIAYYLYINSSYVHLTSYFRNGGMPIRLVTDSTHE
jgi:hypothetical protein